MIYENNKSQLADKWDNKQAMMTKPIKSEALQYEIK